MWNPFILNLFTLDTGTGQALCLASLVVFIFNRPTGGHAYLGIIFVRPLSDVFELKGRDSNSCPSAF